MIGIARAFKHIRHIVRKLSRKYEIGNLAPPGSGAGKGGGAGGAIKEAGGSFGKQVVAREEEYFYTQQKELLAKLKSSLEEENKLREEEIEKHKRIIEDNKRWTNKLERQMKMHQKCDDNI